MKNIWLITGGMVSCLAGAVIGACGSSTSTGTGAGGSTGTTMTTTTSSSGNPTTTSSGNTTTSSSGNTTTSSSGTTTTTSSSGTTTTTSSSGTTTTSSSSGTTSSSSSSSTTTASSAGGTCHSSLPTLHTSPNGSIYCGFLTSLDGGLTCMTGQECCIGGATTSGGFANDDCETWGTNCTNPPGMGLQVECNQTGDCTANGKTNNICCLNGTTPAQIAGCPTGDIQAKGGTGATCVAATTCGTGNTQLCLQDTDCTGGLHCIAFRWKIVQLGYCG